MLVYLIVHVPDMEAVPYVWGHVGRISLNVFQILFKIRKSELCTLYKRQVLCGFMQGTQSPEYTGPVLLTKQTGLSIRDFNPHSSLVAFVLRVERSHHTAKSPVQILLSAP